MGARTLFLSSVGGLVVGQAVYVGWNITDRFVTEFHGDQGWWQATNEFGAFSDFFIREIAAIDTEANSITLDALLQYRALVADGAAVRPFANGSFFVHSGVVGIGISTSHFARDQNCTDGAGTDYTQEAALRLERCCDPARFKRS